MDSTVETESFRFLGTTISQDLKWDYHIDSITKRAQQRLYFFRQMRKFNLPQEQLTQFYSAAIQSVLCSSNCLVDSATKSGIRILRQTARPTEKIIGTPQPNHQDMYTSRVRKRTEKNHSGPSHPVYFLFILLPSGWRYRALSTKTARHKNSFFHQAIFHLNNTVGLHICT